jgi:hypothetical protein
MTKNSRAKSHGRHQVETACLVQWIFRRGSENVTCQVDVCRNGSTTYQLAVVPHRDVEAATIETIKSPLIALQRHAEIANRLREDGWSVARRTAVN